MAEVAQAPSTSNLANTEDLPIQKRLYIGGLSSQLTSSEIEEKFSRFGKITKNLEISQKFTNSSSKFGFLEILINSKNWKNLLSTLNGSNWKGSKLKIQEAKPSTFERITNERVNTDNLIDSKDKKKNRKRIMCEHSKDFNLVNIDNYEANTHWKKLRFDKLIRSMKIRRPNGIILNYDPKNYQKNFKKFKNDDEVSEASLKGLNWEDIVTPEASDSSDYDSSSEDDSSEDDSEESGDYESDENAVEGLFDSGDDVQSEGYEGGEIEDEEEDGVEDNVQPINESTDYNNEAATTIEEPNPTQPLDQVQPPSIIQQLSNPAQPPSIIQQLSTQEQPTQVEEVPVRPQTPEPAKPKSKIDLLIDSIINDGPEVPKQEPKKVFRRRVQKAKPTANNKQDEDQKPDEGQAPSSSFSFNFNF